jgi:Catalytic LigB subunit of aromatic ring-opening dioxygenase
MANIVIGLGTAHGPMLAIEPELWVERAQGEMLNTAKVLNKLDGSFVSYQTLLAEVGEQYPDQPNLDVFKRQNQQCQRALDRLADDLEAANPDVVIMIGNDQLELFRLSNMPALAIYYGAQIATYHRRPEGMPNWRRAVSAGYAMDRVHYFPGEPELGKHLITSLIRKGFDVGACNDVPDPETLGFGHAYGFAIKRLYKGKDIPTIPVLLNTFSPPNIPTAKRCYDFGHALREAIDEQPSGTRVAIIASGGLSHFICEDSFDQRVLEAMRTGDAETLRALPESALTSGSSETRSWIALAGALEGHHCDWMEYIPIKRTPVGTGQGMAFATWLKETD